MELLSSSTPALGTDITNDDSLLLSVSVMESMVMTHTSGENTSFSAMLQVRSRSNVSTRLQSCEGLARREGSLAQFQTTIFSSRK